MGAFKRWQDWLIVLAGICVVAAPYVFGETSSAGTLWATGIIGVLLVLTALLASSTERANSIEWLPGIMGGIVFLAPWVFGYSDLTSTAWTSWAAGAVAMLAAIEVTVTAPAPHGV